jgi:hypothetical protein
MANKYNGIVLGTGDMSELALGSCSINLKWANTSSEIGNSK